MQFKNYLCINCSLDDHDTTSKNKMQFKNYLCINCSLDDHDGNEYLQSMAKFLKTEYMNKFVQDIFRMVDAVIKVIFSRIVVRDSMKSKVSIV